MSSARALTALATALAAMALAGCGEGAELGSGDLRWEESPTVVTPETLPDDRVAQGRVRNDSLRQMDLVARDLRLVDEGGDEVPGGAIFTETFGRSFYSPSRGQLPEAERVRVGLEALLKPGDAVPLTVTWRESDGHAVAVDYGRGSLPLP